MPGTPLRMLPTFSLRALLGLVLLAGILSLFAVLVQSARERSRAAQYLNDLKQIGLGLLNYESTFRCLPSVADRNMAGQTGCSWRAMVLPYVESVRIPRDTTKPWTAAENAVLRAAAPTYYCGEKEAGSSRTFWTKVLGITGPDACFDFNRNQALRVSDAAPDLIVAIEVRDSGIHWMEPRDLDYRELIERERSGDLKLGAWEDSIGVVFLDGRAWRLRADTPRDVLLKFMTIGGARANDAEELLGSYRWQ